ncbi:MAG: hypothetical protein J1F64_09165, partial [Oscillospiraceae bacterium]|nr:hypothetical protein [Oscillospiraceae bacterium]
SESTGPDKTTGPSESTGPDKTAEPENNKVATIGIYKDHVEVEREIKNGKILFTVTALDETDISGIRLFIALYGIGGELIGVKTGESIVFGNKLMICEDMPVTAKYMLWDKNMHPVIKAQIY